MSKKIKRVVENIEELQQEYWDFLNSPYGSLIGTVNLLKGDDGLNDIAVLNRAKKAEFPFIEDPEFIKKTVEAVGFDYEKDCKNKPIAVVTSEQTKNMLFLPFIWNEEDEIPVLLPIRRDGLLPRTARDEKAKIRIIDWSTENN